MRLTFLCSKNIIVIKSCVISEWIFFKAITKKRAWNSVLETARASLAVWLAAAAGKLSNGLGCRERHSAQRKRMLLGVSSSHSLLWEEDLGSWAKRICHAWLWRLHAWLQHLAFRVLRSTELPSKLSKGGRSCVSVHLADKFLYVFILSRQFSVGQ